MSQITVQAPADRDVTLSDSGVSITVKAGTKRQIQPFMAGLAATNGCFILPPEGGAPVPQEGQAGVAIATQRLETLKDLVRKLIDAGDPDAFTKEGRPKKAIIDAGVEFEASIEEIEAAYEAVLEE